MMFAEFEPGRIIDTANGAIFHIENVTKGTLAGWGSSYTDLEFDEKNSRETVDASRLELYYNWRF